MERKKEMNKLLKIFPDLSKIINFFGKKLQTNLYALILTGSLPAGYFKNNWSDVDILVVVEKLDLKTKQTLAKTRDALEKKYKRRFGLNAVNVHNVAKPFFPAISLDGKVLQSLLEINEHPERIIFSKKEGCVFYLPTKKEVKNYSLSNIAMLLLRNRKALINKNPHNFYDYKDMAAKEIRASFIIAKLSIQYFTLYSCVNNKDVVKKAEKIFKGFNFNALKNNLLAIDRWPLIKKRSQLTNIFNRTDKFIEEFSSYVLKKAEKN